MSDSKMRDAHNAMLRKVWATGHCNTALQTELALLLDARAHEISQLREHIKQLGSNANVPYLVNSGWTCPKCGLTEAGHIQIECDWRPSEFAQGKP